MAIPERLPVITSHRFREDIALMAELGVRHYRFSISWPRILPEGRGQVNHEGLAFYSELVDFLLSYDITPHVTLFHWDSPQALESRVWFLAQSANGGRILPDYAAIVVKHLGDRISHWITLNEIFCFTHLGYGVNQVPEKWLLVRWSRPQRKSGKPLTMLC